MTVIQAQVSDDLLEQLETIAQQQSLSIEQLVSQALAVQVEAWTEREYLQRRSQQGSWEHFQAVLAKVPSVEPEEFDRL
jgi:predicted transcriptional regulator